MARTMYSKRLRTCILFFTLLGTGVSSFAASTQEDVTPVRNVSPGIFPSSIIVNDVFSNEGPGIDYTVTGSVTKEEPKEPEKLNYCVNIHDDAKEARSAILKDRLMALETNVDEKLEKLEKRINVLKNGPRSEKTFSWRPTSLSSRFSRTCGRTQPPCSLQKWVRAWLRQSFQNSSRNIQVQF